MQIFVDMDGVLADFDAHYEAVLGVRPDKITDNVDWSAVRAVKDFYLNHPPSGRPNRSVGRPGQAQAHNTDGCPPLRRGGFGQ